MNRESLWTKTDWLSSAKLNLEWIASQPLTERIMLFLRHSHREAISDHSFQLSTALTQLGKDMSYEMGRQLPIKLPARVFYSFVPRCYETADEIAKGFQEVGGKVVEMEPLEILVAPVIIDDKVWSNLQPDGRNVTEFVNDFADGNFGVMVEPFEAYRSRLMAATIERLRITKSPELHIHVTHDLAVMAIKRILLGRPLEFEDREPFLGGISVSAAPDSKIKRHIR